MSDYDNRRADAYEDRLRVIHELTKTPGPAVLILEQIAKLTDPDDVEKLKGRALDGDA
ncbi:hypothetical protein [Brevibacterium sandarakinum]|uniref:hypothetical protein n=1 Tax=Brevibacterium sandarakinum TaxID=629680 RepID=UPI002655E48C|nr:hypothetical protein [Brevibacterium sandarakinum]MDN5659010.1 hypothetical protein [Brevibacterium sandarakinum]